MPTFGELLREFRVRAGLSQSELAEKASLSEVSVGALERGARKAPYRSTVALLAKALGLSPQDSAALETARAAVRTKVHQSAVAHNIQLQRTSLVDREGDIAQILRLLHRSRLVTVTGSGGVGKTRAVLEAAWQILGDPWDEVWFIDLAPLIDGDYIPAKIASTIQPPVTDRAETIAALATAIANRRMLLILDNCEHVVEQAAEAADVILRGCPHISILATSRERLGVAGEFVYRLPSLSAEPAADLFIQRAEAADQQLSFDAAKLPVVTEIAQGLGGIPLALELIAAQVPVLGLETLRTHLHAEFRVASGRRDLPARQQTVIATIRWSYGLLTADEQALLSDASIFSGGFALGAAEAVCGHGTLQRSQILPLLLSLVNKSLINVESYANGIRYSLLESVRSFGLERLQEAGQYEEVARHHARWLAAVAEDVENTTAYLSAERAAELLPDFDNVRAAIAWSLSATRQEDRVFSVQILTGLLGLWDRVGRRREHRRMIDTALERIDEEQNPLAASYLLRDLLMRAQQERSALDIIDRALPLCERSGDQLAMAKLLLVAAQILALHCRLETSEAFMERASTSFIAAGLQRSMLFAALLFSRSQLRVQQGRIDDARIDIDGAEKIALANGDRYYVVCFTYVRRAEIEYAAGNKRLALECVERMLQSEFASDGQVAMLALGRIPNLRLQLGDVEGAIQPLCEWLQGMRGNEGFTHGELEFAALALALKRKPIAAARLLGRVRAIEELAPFARSAMRQGGYDMLLSSLHQQLDDDAIAAVIAEGARLTGDEAVTEALDGLQHIDEISD